MRPLFASAIALVCLTSGLALGQTAQNSSTTGATNVQIQFNGTISTTVMLTVTGGGPTTLTGTTSAIAPAAALGTVDFGTFTTTQPLTAINSSRYRTSVGPPGAVVAATLVATIIYNGSATGSILVARKLPAAGLPDVPLANLRLASPSLASWNAGTQGTMVPNAGGAGFNICTAAGDPTCINDKSYTHQLAVFVPDAQVSGPFSTAVVYTATSP